MTASLVDVAQNRYTPSGEHPLFIDALHKKLWQFAQHRYDDLVVATNVGATFIGKPSKHNPVFAQRQSQQHALLYAACAGDRQALHMALDTEIKTAQQLSSVLWSMDAVRVACAVGAARLYVRALCDTHTDAASLLELRQELGELLYLDLTPEASRETEGGQMRILQRMGLRSSSDPKAVLVHALEEIGRPFVYERSLLHLVNSYTDEQVRRSIERSAHGHGLHEFAEEISDAKHKAYEFAVHMGQSKRVMNSTYQRIAAVGCDCASQRPDKLKTTVEGLFASRGSAARRHSRALHCNAQETLQCFNPDLAASSAAEIGKGLI